MSRATDTFSDNTALYEVMREIAALVPGSEEGFLNFGMWDRPEEVSPPRRFGEYLLERAGIEQGHRVLDVGCGLGALDRICAETYRPAVVVGLDIEPAHTERAAEEAARRGLSGDLRYVTGDATRFPEELGGPYDRILTLEAVEGFPSRRRFLAEAHRTLAAGGRLVMAEAFIRWHPRDEVEQECIDTQAAFWGLAAPLYRPEDCDADLREAGFLDVSFESVRQHVYKPLVAHLRRNMAQVRALLAARLDETLQLAVLDLIDKTERMAELDWYEFAIVDARKAG